MGTKVGSAAPFLTATASRVLFTACRDIGQKANLFPFLNFQLGFRLLKGTIITRHQGLFLSSPARTFVNRLAQFHNCTYDI